MVLHSLPLAIESIILGTREGRAFGAGEAALEGSADGWGAQLGCKALGGAEQRSLREHFCVVVVQLLLEFTSVVSSNAVQY